MITQFYLSQIHLTESRFDHGADFPRRSLRLDQVNEGHKSCNQGGHNTIDLAATPVK